MKEEKGSIGVAPVTPAVAPVNANEETLNITSTTRIEKEAKIGSNQFECTVCYKTFSCRKNVRRHMMAIHKVAPPPGAPLNATPRPLSGNFNRATISRSSEESIDGDEKYEDGTEVKTEEMGEESAVPPPNVSQPVPQNIVPPETVKKENGVGSERDQVMGEKRKLPKNENRVERETPLDFGSPIANKKIRMDAIREEDRAVITAQSVRLCVSRIGAMRASPLLASLLSNTREISLDVSPSALQIMLLVYSDNSKLNVDNIVVVAEMALKLKVNQLKNLCEKFIMAELPRLSLMRAIRLTDMYKLVKVKDELFDSLSIEALRTMAANDDYRDMRPELKAELLDKFGEFL
ncbi:hypothetical protein PMAYCL1PPCAC_06819 [Pristionchus mayeri]|uniref:C2H2-type domain-containing protein n=1 Tax=Pristionchus mayeri TaxID=1317129 RepID=A0AAN4ZAY4_9BILA|nr:hypothetical protein PMAYCL1PPCAC_06819 [Pristionchus mayeri]